MSQPLKYEVLGGNFQAIRVTLAPKQTLIGEAGCMLFIDQGIGYESKSGDGSAYNAQQSDGWMSMFKNMMTRVLTNESLFNTWFTNNAGRPLSMAVAAPRMGTILAVNLGELPNRAILAQSGAFLCSSVGVKFTIALTQRFGAGIFGGEGFILQRMSADSNSAGQLFLHGGGCIVRRELKNEKFLLEAGSLMAFTDGIDYDIAWNGWKNAGFGGGGLFLASLQGTGSVWIQSSPESRLIDQVISAIPTKSDNN